MTIGELIEAIGPLNNRYRETDGIDRIETLWEIGEAIESATDGPLDDLLWAIQQRSFITRDLLRYASIVRRSWPVKASLRSQFGRVTSYSLFREALPFLKGNREGINEATYKLVVELISSADTTKARRSLQALKQEYIGRKHRKGVSHAKVSELVESFKAQVLELERGLAEKPGSTGINIRDAYGESLNVMGQILYAMATGGVIPSEVLQHLLLAVTHPLVAPVAVAAAGTREQRSAFVKDVGSNVLMELADLFIAVKTDDSYRQWQNRPHISLHIGGESHDSNS